MLFLFLSFFLTKSQIPDHLKHLAIKAIEDSKNKTDLKERIATAYPGEYSFPNVEFSLKRTLCSPNTNNIKGFAIENELVAIVKRKNYNQQNNFVFIDPTDQQFYDMEKLIASDDQVNIYCTKKLTLFDVITNFNYHAKSEKLINPTIELNWDSSRDSPKLKQIPHVSGFDYGLGARGEFTIETYLRFKSSADINIGASIKIDIKAAAELQFQNGSSSGSSDFVLFELPPIAIRQLGFSINFFRYKTINSTVYKM